MKFFTRAFLSLCALLPAAFGLSGQDVVNIADGGTVDEVSCAAYVVITDSGGESGNYGPNEDHVITLCVEAASTNNAEVTISPELYGDTWDVDANSTLFVYDGPTTAAPLLGAFNTVDNPYGLTLEATQRCITLEFVSGAGSTGAGFTATFSCVQPLQPFLFDVTGVPDLEPFDDLDHEAIKICFSDSIELDVSTSYPLSDAGGYAQEDATSLFRYDMGDGTIYQGFGMTHINHTYSVPLGYLVTILITDVAGKVESQQLYVLIAPRPHFSNLPVEDTLCIGEQTTITGGIDGGDTLGVDPSTSAILGGGILGEQLYLPDGNDENYQTTIPIDVFEPGQEITSITDIVNMCVNIEHSYLGDLEMMLTCPDGTSVNIFNSYTGDGLFPGGFGGGGTYLGDANDTGPNGVPGIGFTYCWTSDNPEFGTMGEEFAAGNTVPVNTFQSGNAMAPGVYTPEESFANFIGCPINGDWTLTVRDNLGIDDGFIFNWSIYFDPNINPTTVYYSPDIDSVYWGDNDDIIADLGTSIEVLPSQEGDNAFTFYAVDEFGCTHDTTINVYVRPYVEIEDNIACDLTHTLVPANAPNGAQWTTISAPNEDAVAQFTDLGAGAADVITNAYGIYGFEIVENNCSYTDTAYIDFRPNPQVAPLVPDTVLCIGASINLDAGPQLPNSGNFTIVWSRNGEAFNTTDYDVTVDQTGQYVVHLIGVCGEASDTSNVVAIELEVQGDTIGCGPMNFGQLITLNPEGSGQWSSSSEAISFSDPASLFTEVYSDDYGTFPVTFTDSRCLDDHFTRNLTFVEQPRVTISPEHPVFCLEEDTLKLSASTTGSHDGFYFWDISGANAPGIDNDMDRYQTFYPESFDALEVYTVSVSVLDDYEPHICPQADTSIVFEGQACIYHVPNVISPNGDGKNDRFTIQYIESFPSTRLRIYNRWGETLFEQDNYDLYQRENGGWAPEDGTTPGVYFYELSIPYIDRIETGELTILDKAD